MDRSAFLAYASNVSSVAETLREAASKFNEGSDEIELHGWEANDISGRELLRPILDEIERSKFVVTDVSTINDNVTFELGYALATEKRCFIVRHKNEKIDRELINHIGIFDTLGYQEYENSTQLSDYLLGNIDKEPIPIEASINREAPIYILEPTVRDDAYGTIVSAVKKARWKYRSFSPPEDIRLSAMDAIRNVTQSAGVIVTIINSDANGALENNVRACFLSGICYALNIPLLILHRSDTRLPSDIKDITQPYSHFNAIRDHVHRFSLDVTEYLQTLTESKIHNNTGLIDLNIGDPTAENEMTTLSDYYLMVDAYKRSLSGNVNLVTGRKGSGKTALFVQLRNKIRKDKRNIVLDLRPEGYHLIKLKEKILDLLSEGSKQHLITLFWEYVLLIEIARKMLEKDEQKSLNDQDMAKSFDRLNEIHERFSFSVDGDFSERIEKFADFIVGNYEKKGFTNDNGTLAESKITELLHQNELKELFQVVVTYLEYKESCWILFDNIDKGWSLSGVSKDDMFVLRCLLDACRKLERDMRKNRLKFRSIVFVRDDIYSLLLQGSADYGKEMRASLDWSDRDLLAQVLSRRISSSLENNPDTPISELWPQICVSHIRGEESLSFMVERSLMRPRNLLKLFQHCIGSAVNHNHDKIQETDIHKGFSTYSMDLLTEIDRELSDVSVDARDVIYEFLDENRDFTESDIRKLIVGAGVSENEAPRIIDYFIYYGVIGFKSKNNDSEFIYDNNYNTKVFNTKIRKAGTSAKYIVNSALWAALGMDDENEQMKLV